ncbi:MAG: AMP-binding protein [Candidatus Nanopelagicales bacterium]|nr:AMP-binding protein [Candidatus Nanopelagicales bacterium]MDZ4249652.1 AMP-binding protein [Candidatus Nanopelagicales bacterium]
MALELLTRGVSPSIGWAGGAARHPKQIALIDTDGQRWTFAQAEALTLSCTHQLREAGLEPGKTAAILGRNSGGFALAMASVSRTGADLVYLNPGFTEPQLEAMIADRGIKLVLADAALAPRLPEGTPMWLLDDLASRSIGAPADLTKSPGGRHVILTSGTTGKPKGADRSRTPLEATVSMLAALPFRQGSTHVMAAPMFHAWGWMNHRLAGLLDVTEVMLTRASATDILDAVEDHRARIVVTTPVAVGRLAEEGPGDRDLSCLEGVLVSGSLLGPDVVTRFLDAFGPVLYNVYGSTEAGPTTCASPEDLAADPSTAGRPLPGVDVRVLDDQGRPLGPGQIGEIWAGSPIAFDGYVDGTDSKRESGLLTLGDQGLIDFEGRLKVVGRDDDLIICGGENVHPAEVETVLQQHPEIADVVAVGIADETFGQVVAAHVVPADPDAEPDALAARIQDWAAERLAPYQRPKKVVVHDTIPRDELGKVQRRLL